MSFQLPPNTSAPGGGFAFGATNTTATAGANPVAKTSSFTFGATGGGDAGSKGLGFGFGTPAATVALATNTASPQTTAAAKPTLGLGGTGTASFGFGSGAATIATTSAAAPVAAAAPAPVQTTGFGFGNATNPAQVPAATTAAPQTPVAASTSGFSFGTQASVVTAPVATPANTVLTTASGTPLQAAAAPTPSSKSAAPGIGGFARLNTATKTTETSAVTNASQLSYSQLEEHINKWTLELEEQEKVFTDQATQINAWDKILISNNQKILDLNDAVQKVKSDQQTLEQELEFIATQHKELEECIVPLQKEFLKIPQVDVERSQTYLMVENLDTQLKQMSEDLKEIIDNLNESNKCQDNTDPIIQIGKILNAHMSSLQWIEQSATNIGNKLEDINKMHETFKRDSEKSFRSAYYN